MLIKFHIKKDILAHGMDDLKSSFFWNIFRKSFPNYPIPSISHMELEPCKNLIL